MRKLYNFKSLYKYVVESRDKIQKKIQIFIWIRLFLKIRIIIQKIRIPPSGSQMTKKIRIRPASISKLEQKYLTISPPQVHLMGFPSCFCQIDLPIFLGMSQSKSHFSVTALYQQHMVKFRSVWTF